MQNKLSEETRKKYLKKFNEFITEGIVACTKADDTNQKELEEKFLDWIATELSLQKSEMEEKVEKARKEERKRVYLEIAKNPLTIIGILKDNQ